MFQSLKYVCVVGLTMISIHAFGQIGQNQGGESCAEAVDLGLIGPDGSCPGGAGFVGENTAVAKAAIMDPSCDKVGTNHDIWYKFLAPRSGRIMLNIELGSASRVEAALYENCQGKEIICTSSNADGLCVSGLDEGQTYYLQLWSDGFAVGSFDFCIQEKPSPNDNDDCDNATPLPLTPPSNPCDDVDNDIIYNNFGSTPSGRRPEPTCGTFGMGRDVWFSTTIPSSGNLMIEMTETIGPKDWAMAVYTGDCNNLEELACDDDSGEGLKPKIEFFGERPGLELKIRVWEFGGDEYGSFKLQASDQSTAPPVNNICNLAVDLTVVDQEDACLDPVCGHNLWATPSNELPTPSCGGFGSGTDVWYKVTVPPSGNLAIVLSSHSPKGPDDWAMALYSGTCGNLQEIVCDDDGGTGFFPKINKLGLTPGDAVYIRVWEYQGDDAGSFFICVSGKTPLPVNFLEFAGQSLNHGNEIFWSVSQEFGLEKYELERSLDAVDYEVIHVVAASDEAVESTKSYHYLDLEAPDRAYYRLRSIDVDGQMSYSKTIYIENKDRKSTEVRISPIPASDFIQVFTQSDHLLNRPATIQILTTGGQVIRNVEVEQFYNGLGMDIGDLSAGVYLMKIGNGKNQSISRMVKK